MSGALRHGHFLLSSGRHSAAYVQCALLLEDPRRARRVGQLLAKQLASWGPESVLAPAIGGLIIGHEVAMALKVPFRFTERSEGEMSLRRGFGLARDERVVIVEDVVTTGRSSLETRKVAEDLGARVCGLGSIIDRTEEGLSLPLPLRALLRLELPSYVAEDCPLCDQGSSPEKPGSRPPAG